MSTLGTVIGRGLASAKPSSPRVGYLYASTDEGVLERYSGSAWEPISAISQMLYEFDTTTADADPTAGQIRFNNATPGSVTEIYIDDDAANHPGGGQMDQIWQNIDGAVVMIHSLTDHTHYWIGTVDTSSNETPSYTKWLVSELDSGSLPANGELLEVSVYGGGGGGGGGAASVSWWDKPQVNILTKQTLKDGKVTDGNGQLVSLLTGTADGDGKAGAGGYTELSVGCSCAYDTSPSLSTVRGYNVFDQDVDIGTGQYMRTSVRFPEANDQNLFVMLCTTGAMNLNAGIANTGSCIGLVKRSTDANWQVGHNDGATNQTYVDTGVAWATGDWLNVEIYIWDAGGGTMNAKVWIDGVLVATVITALPAATLQTVRPHWGTWFLSTGATATYDVVMFTTEIFWASEDEGLLDGQGWATL